ncbi:MAG: hypothetical protein HY847_19975 [Betaproteobacteria bacterium]|nr:hypothetical protein [Betaproteobacteria bacterium]
MHRMHALIDVPAHRRQKFQLDDIANGWDDCYGKSGFLQIHISLSAAPPFLLQKCSATSGMVHAVSKKRSFETEAD